MSDLKNLTKDQLIELIGTLEAAKQTLTESNAAGEAENKAQAAEIFELKSLIDSQKEELAIKNQELASKNEELATAENMLEEQQEALLKLETNSGPSDKTVVSFKGDRYIVAAPRFLVGSRECSADELLTNSDLVATLIEKRSSVLRLIKEN